MNHDLAVAIRESWRRGKPWLAVGILSSVSLITLLLWTEYVNTHRGIAESRATGLGAVAGSWDPISMLEYKVLRARYGDQFFRPMYQRGAEMPPDSAARFVVRSGSMRIVVMQPGPAMETLKQLAASSNGFVLNSTISGQFEQQSAQIVMRLPAEVLDEARRQVRALAVEVQVDTVEAKDVTREVTDQRATLRNLHATEQQYLALMKHATRIEDVALITGKLSDIRGQIDRLEAEARLLAAQVTMSSLSVDVMAYVAPSPLQWKPFQVAREAVRGLAEGFIGYGDAMIGFAIRIPVIALWIATILVIMKAGWWLISRVFALLFLRGWHRGGHEPTASV